MKSLEKLREYQHDSFDLDERKVCEIADEIEREWSCFADSVDGNVKMLERKVDELTEERDRLQGANNLLENAFNEKLDACGELQARLDGVTAERDHFIELFHEQNDLANRLVTERDTLYMKLPVDADGVPCKPGDKVKWTDGEYTDTFVVEGYTSEYPNGQGRMMLVSEQDIHYYADGSHHIKPRTLEDVLRGFFVDLNSTRPFDEDTENEITNKYAAEIRELLGGDGE